MGLSFWHIIIVLAVVLIVFGAGKLPNVMGDLGKGIRSFKAGLNDDKVADNTDHGEQVKLPPKDEKF